MQDNHVRTNNPRKTERLEHLELYPNIKGQLIGDHELDRAPALCHFKCLKEDYASKFNDHQTCVENCALANSFGIGSARNFLNDLLLPSN